jgi:hypothetical protein
MPDSAPNPNLKPPAPPSQSTLLLIAITVLTVAGGYIAVSLQTARPGDSTALVIIVLAFFSTTIGVLLVLLKNMSDLHTLVNSRLGDLVDEARSTALLKGRAEGIEATSATWAAAAAEATAAATTATAKAVADSVAATAAAMKAADKREVRAYEAGLVTPTPGADPPAAADPPLPAPGADPTP